MKPKLLLVALVMLLDAQALFASGQNPSPHENSSPPITLNGILKSMSSSYVEIAILAAPEQTPRTMTFVINQNTKRSQITTGDMVVVTYIRKDGKLVAIALDRTGGLTPPGSATPLGTAHVTPAGSDKPDIIQAQKETAERAINIKNDNLISPGTRVLNDDDIIELVKAGQPDDLIISTINKQPGAYDTSANELSALKDAGGSDRVISAIIIKQFAKSTAIGSAPPPAPGTRNPDDALLQNPDIYILKDRLSYPSGPVLALSMDVTGAVVDFGQSHKDAVPIRPAYAKVEQTAAAFSYGDGLWGYARFRDSKAATRSKEKRPTFYMFFPRASKPGMEISIDSPAQLSLLRLEVGENSRAMRVATSAFGHSRPSFQGKMRFKAKEIGPFTFMVTPEAKLKPGEYAFVTATEYERKEPSKIFVAFDFGIDPK